MRAGSLRETNQEFSPWNVISWHVRALSYHWKQQNCVKWNIVWRNVIRYKKRFLFLFLCFWVSVSASSNKMYFKTFYPPFPIQIVLLSPMTEIRWVSDAATIFCVVKLLRAPLHPKKVKLKEFLLPSVSTLSTLSWDKMRRKTMVLEGMRRPIDGV